MATLWTLSQAVNLLTFYGPDGVSPALPVPGVGGWTLLSISTSAPVVIGLWVVTLFGAVGVMIGFRTRLATVLLFVGVLSLNAAIRPSSTPGTSCFGISRSISSSRPPVRPCRWIGGAAPAIGSGSSRYGHPGPCG